MSTVGPIYAQNATIVVSFATPVVSAGTAYCLPIKQPGGANSWIPPSTLSKIVAEGTSVAIHGSTMVVGTRHVSVSVASVSLSLVNLQAFTSYHVFCYAQLASGVGGSYGDTIATGLSFNTTCCNTIQYSNTPTFVLGDVTQYMTSNQPATYTFSYVLSELPMGSSSITITPIITQAIDHLLVTSVNATPSSLTFTSASTQLSGSFVLSALSSYSASCLITLSVTGTGSMLYKANNAQITKLRTATVSIVSSSQPLPAPTLKNAYFAANGASVLISFSAGTDLGGMSLAASSEWTCSLLFSFPSASSAICSWVNSSAVSVSFGAVTTGSSTNGLLVPGNVISVVGGKVRATCRATSATTTSSAAASTSPAACNKNLVLTSGSVLAQMPLIPLVPNAVLILPKKLSSCASLLVDLSSSTGHGGRPWSRVHFSAISSTSNSYGVALTTYLNKNFDPNSGTAINILNMLESYTPY